MKSTTHNRGRKVTKRGLSTEQKIWCCAVLCMSNILMGSPGHLFTQFGPRHSLRIFDGVPGSSFYHNSDPNMFFEYFVGVPRSSFYRNADHDMFFAVLYMFGS